VTGFKQSDEHEVGAVGLAASGLAGRKRGGVGPSIKRRASDRVLRSPMRMLCDKNLAQISRSILMGQRVKSAL
jgi:hypothetical protein